MSNIRRIIEERFVNKRDDEKRGILISDQRMGKDNDLYELNSFGVCEVIKMYVPIDQMQSNKKKLLHKVIS